MEYDTWIDMDLCLWQSTYMNSLSSTIIHDCDEYQDEKWKVHLVDD